MKDKLLDLISNSSLEQILDINELDSMDWIWINRGIFRDILLNLSIDETFGEDILESFHDTVDDKELIDSLKKPFSSKGYIPVHQFLFSMYETGFKPTKDIETVIFIQEKSYKKMIIKLTNEFNWMLKAMAIDTFLKMGTNYSSIGDAYEDLYEGNSRIIEILLSKGEHTYLTGRWKLEKKTKELLFFKEDEIYQRWGEGEAESRFKEATK